MNQKFLDLISEVNDDEELLEMNRLLVARLKDVRRIKDMSSLSKLRSIPIGARVEIRWRDQYTYHGTYTGMGRSKVHANIDELGGRGYRFPPNWIVKVLDEKEKPGVKIREKGKLTVVAPPGTPDDVMKRTLEIHAIADEAKKLRDEIEMSLDAVPKIDWAEHRRKEDAVWERIRKLDESCGPGLHIGRCCSWPVADGKAIYLVSDIGRRVRLIHIPLWDAYQSDAVDDRGTASLSTVEKNIRFQDGLHKIFAKRAQEG